MDYYITTLCFRIALRYSQQSEYSLVAAICNNCAFIRNNKHAGLFVAGVVTDGLLARQCIASTNWNFHIISTALMVSEKRTYIFCTALNCMSRVYFVIRPNIDHRETKSTGAYIVLSRVISRPRFPQTRTTQSAILAREWNNHVNWTASDNGSNLKILCTSSLPHSYSRVGHGRDVYVYLYSVFRYIYTFTNRELSLSGESLWIEKEFTSRHPQTSDRISTNRLTFFYISSYSISHGGR